MKIETDLTCISNPCGDVSNTLQSTTPLYNCSFVDNCLISYSFSQSTAVAGPGCNRMGVENH